MDKDRALASVAVIAAAGAAVYLVAKITSGEGMDWSLFPGEPRRYQIPEIWHVNLPGFSPITQAQRDRIESVIPILEHAAVEIAEAPGFWVDDEAKALRALFRCRSRFELLYLNKVFTRLELRTLNSFEPGGPPPMLGAWLDQFLETSDWRVVADWYESLPKFLP